MTSFPVMLSSKKLLPYTDCWWTLQKVKLGIGKACQQLVVTFCWRC